MIVARVTIRCGVTKDPQDGRVRKGRAARAGQGKTQKTAVTQQLSSLMFEAQSYCIFFTPQNTRQNPRLIPRAAPIAIFAWTCLSSIVSHHQYYVCPSLQVTVLSRACDVVVAATLCL